MLFARVGTGQCKVIHYPDPPQAPVNLAGEVAMWEPETDMGGCQNYGNHMRAWPLLWSEVL